MTFKWCSHHTDKISHVLEIALTLSLVSTRDLLLPYLSYHLFLLKGGVMNKKRWQDRYDKSLNCILMVAYMQVILS